MFFVAPLRLLKEAEALHFASAAALKCTRFGGTVGNLLPPHI